MIALATCAAMPTGYLEDELAERLGARWAVWNDPGVDWSAFDLVVVRSTWDCYLDDLAPYLAWVEGLPRVVNAPAVFRWNTDKRYLDEVAAAGLPTVPTTFLAPGEPLPAELPEELVLKPTVSAGSRDTGRFTSGDAGVAELLAAIHASGRTAMLQPFLPSVDTRGETALLYAAGTFSHAVNKGRILEPGGRAVPMDGGGDPVMVATEPEPAERALADRTMAWLQERLGPLAYARVDLLAGPDGAPAILELELAEPCLYLPYAEGAAERFAAVFRALA